MIGSYRYETPGVFVTPSEWDDDDFAVIEALLPDCREKSVHVYANEDGDA